MARPRKQIPQEVRDIILALIGAGDSDRRVSRITRVQPREWQRIADENKGFAALLETAKNNRNGNLAKVLRESMVAQIQRGHPWWAKLAIHNYKTLLKDPDVIGAAKVKAMAEKLTRTPDGDLLTTDPALAAVKIPPGAVPSMASPGPVQDDPRGTA